jgi:hypothetical protein
MPHVTQTTSSRCSATDARTDHGHDSYAISLRIRKRIEKTLGWVKDIAGQEKLRFGGFGRGGFAFTFAAAAYGRMRLSSIGTGMPRWRTKVLKGKVTHHRNLPGPDYA